MGSEIDRDVQRKLGLAGYQSIYVRVGPVPLRITIYTVWYAAGRGVIKTTCLAIVGKPWLVKVNQRLEQRELDMELDKILRSNQVIFERPDKTVTSVEYWENYFDEHPDTKPSKIVYYTGGDPTQALQQWKRDNGLSKQSEPGELKQLEKLDPDKVTDGKNLLFEIFKSC